MFRLLGRGILPSPDDLREYERILPGLADRIVAMAESEIAHRQRIQLAEWSERSAGRLHNGTNAEDYAEYCQLESSLPETECNDDTATVDEVDDLDDDDYDHDEDLEEDEDCTEYGEEPDFTCYDEETDEYLDRDDSPFSREERGYLFADSSVYYPYYYNDDCNYY